MVTSSLGPLHESLRDHREYELPITLPQYGTEEAPQRAQRWRWEKWPHCVSPFLTTSSLVYKDGAGGKALKTHNKAEALGNVAFLTAILTRLSRTSVACICLSLMTKAVETVPFTHWLFVFLLLETHLYNSFVHPPTVLAVLCV